MSVKKFMIYGLMMTFICSPGWIHPGSIAMQVSALSEVVKMPCYARQPDLSVGAVTYQKGLTALNGSITSVGASLRIGGTLTTAADGFVSVVLGDGTAVSIQPATHLRISCTGFATRHQSQPLYTIDEPHTLGAIRG